MICHSHFPLPVGNTQPREITGYLHFPFIRDLLLLFLSRSQQQSACHFCGFRPPGLHTKGTRRFLPNKKEHFVHLDLIIRDTSLNWTQNTKSCKEETTGTRYMVAPAVTFVDLVAYLLLSCGTHRLCHVLEEILRRDTAVPRAHSTRVAALC